MQGRLGASFFFKRRHPKRGTWNGLFPTIAYQLATSIPALSLHVQRAVEADKLIAGRTMPVQFQRLILEPFRRTGSLEFVPVIVLDGLDECEDHKIQQQILRLITDTIRVNHLPVRILICSRPEPHIREILEAQQGSVIHRHLTLSADPDAYEDIRNYLRHEFHRIYRERCSRGINLEYPWPSPDALTHLVNKSSGMFIYATTVIRFVDDEYSHPEDRLESVLALDPESTAPLDDLYSQILSRVPYSPQQLRILHVSWQKLRLDPEETDTLLELRPGTSRLTLRGLHSLFTVPPLAPPRFGLHRPVASLHASFGDYLGDARRSGPWCVSLPWLLLDALHCTIRGLSTRPETVAARGFHW